MFDWCVSALLQWCMAWSLCWAELAARHCNWRVKIRLFISYFHFLFHYILLVFIEQLTQLSVINWAMLNMIFYLFIYFYLFIFNKFIYFIYLLLAVLGLRFCARAFSGCGERGPLFIAVRGPLTIAASLVAEHGLQTRRLSKLWLMGLVAPRHVGSSQTRARTRVPCIGKQILSHCTTREAPKYEF